jgi:multiple sugar transport system substrate-binding protein
MTIAFYRQVHSALLAVAAVLILPGCGADRSSKEVVFNCAANAQEIEALSKEIPLFTRESGITIKLSPFTGQEKLYAMIAAGQPPDIFYTNSVVRDQLAAQGHLLDLRQVSATDPFTQRLRASAIQRGTSIDGGWYSLSNWIFTLGVYYNRDLFDEAGVPYPDASWTWDQMVATAQKLTKQAKRGKEQYGIFIGSHFVEALEQMNNAPIQPNALFLSVSNESQEVYREYLDLMREEIMPDLQRVQAMGMQSRQMLESGRVAMLVEAVPDISLLETLSIRWGVVPLPRFGNKPPRYFRSESGGFSISSKTGDPAATWEALKWIVSKASIYQPNPIFPDAGFVDGWEARYPKLVGSGFRAVWELSEQHDDGDKRFFVRFSSWTSGTIMERLQPKLDQLWARRISVDQLAATVPEINAAAKREIDNVLKNRNLNESFRKQIEQQLAIAPQ